MIKWLPTATSSTIMDPNQPKPLMKLPISIEQDSMQYHTSVLIDSTTTLNFVSRDLLTRNSLLGKCIREPKIAIRIANEQRISRLKHFHLPMFRWVRKFIGLRFTVLPHLKCVDFIVGLLAMKYLNMSIQLSKDMVLIGDIYLFYSSHNHAGFRAF